MQKCEHCHCHWQLEYDRCPVCRRLLAGVQGPERHLVGDVAERLPQAGGVEDAKPGRRGVGEIVELAKLRRYVERELRKARRVERLAGRDTAQIILDYYRGRETVLAELRKMLTDIAEKRSDLSNA